MKFIVSTNPAKNYEVIGKVPVTSNKEIKDKVQKAHAVKEDWKRLGVTKRVKLLRNVYKLCKERADDIAEIITKEVGTPITVCKDEVAWDFGYFEWFLDNAETFLSPEITHEDKTAIYKVLYEPLGTAAVITPWNLPFDLFLWGVIPNLLVGNTVVYKAAEECILTGKLLEEIMNTSGLPEGVFSAIHGDSQQGAYLVNQNVDLIWFTGSSEVGKSLYETAGKKFVKVILEMGGSNPAIVFDDADREVTVDRIMFKRYEYCGQACDSVKRLIVHEKVFDDVVRLLKKKVEGINFDQPENIKTEMGPLVSKKQLDLLIKQVNDAIKKGAHVVTGGKRPDNLQGAYYLPTILTKVKKNMRVWNEEVFGPVLPIIKFKTEEEAIQLANDTEYGLGSQIYTKDTKRAQRLAEEIKAGGVDINGVNHFKPFNPFGGYKASGMGREHGKYGFHELCQIKVISQEK